MDSRRKRFQLVDSNTFYELYNEWTNHTTPMISNIRLDTAIAAISKPMAKLFVCNMLSGLLVSPDFTLMLRLSDVKTDRLHPVSFDFNRCETESIELAILFGNGYILIFDPIKKSKGKLTWFNSGKKGSQGTLSKRNPILIRWVPGRPDEFVVVFEDNVMWHMNKNKPEDERTTTKLQSVLREANKHLFQPLNSASNPCSVWKFTGGNITDLQFVPTQVENPRMLSTFAVTTADGYLKLFDFNKGTMQFCFRSYFAGFLSLAWSWDGRFIATAGEDDSVNMWDVENQLLVFRGEAHNSWSSVIAFDPLVTFSANNFYRFFSGGHDGKLIVWEVSPDHLAVTTNRRASPVAPQAFSGVIPYPGRNDIPRLECSMEVQITQDPIQCLVAEDNNIFIGDMSGNITQWVLASQEEKEEVEVEEAEASDAMTVASAREI